MNRGGQREDWEMNTQSDHTSGGTPGLTRRWNPTLTSKGTTLGWGTRLFLLDIEF